MVNNEMLENPSELLKNLKELFLIEHDTRSLENIEDDINRLQNMTKDKLRAHHINISEKNGVLEKSNMDVATLSDQLQRAQQEANLYISKDILDREVKKLTELEDDVKKIREDLNDKVSNLVKLDRDINEELNLQDEPSENVDDPVAKANILKLKLYRSMGVIVDSMNDQILINQGDGEIDILSLDNHYSDYFVTKYIWNKLKERN